MSKQVEDNISVFVEDHFPEFYTEYGPEFLAFVKAYYEFLEQEGESQEVARNLLNYQDLDNTISSFTDKFKQQYLTDLPLSTSVDTRTVLKHMMDIYKSKGSARSVELLFRMVYGEEARVVFPSDQVLTASDADYKEPKYLEVSENSIEYLLALEGKEIEGTISGAKAFVDSIATKVVNGREIQVLYLSNVRGAFIATEFIATPLRDLVGAPELLGSLTDVDIVIGGKDYELGQRFNVTAESGKGVQGIVQANALINATGVVEFTFHEENAGGGFGFSTNTTLTNTSVATSMLLVNNFVANVTNTGGSVSTNTLITKFPRFETLVQPLETVSVLSAGANFFANTGAGLIGARVRGTSVSGNITTKVIANGIVSSFSNSSAANGSLVICVDEGTFGNQGAMVYSGNTAGSAFESGEKIFEGADVTLKVADTTGFTAGDVVTANTTGANGTIQAVTNSTHLALNASFGTFFSAGGEKIDEEGAGTANTVIATNGVDITTSGANASITSITNSTVMVIDDIVGAFTPLKKFRGQRTGTIANVASISTTGSVQLFFGAGGATNIATQDTMSNSYVVANIIGSNTANTEIEASGTGVYVGGANTGVFVEDGAFVYSTYKVADESNGTITQSTVNVTGNVVANYTGTGAAFAVANVEDDEVLTLYTDFVGDNNSVNVAFLDVKVAASNSGVGFVDTGQITTAGSGYANGELVTWSSNGIGGGAPTTNATATVTTDGSGGLTGTTVTNHGAGFYTNAGTGTITTSGGSSGVVTARMDFGYGFPKDPQLGLDDFIAKCLDITTGTFGSVTRLGSFNPGLSYNITPFFNLITTHIFKMDRRDIIVTLGTANTEAPITAAADIQPSFVDNEYVSQTQVTQRQRLTNATALVLTSGSQGDIDAGDQAVQVLNSTVNTYAEVVTSNSTTITFKDIITKNYPLANSALGSNAQIFIANTTAPLITITGTVDANTTGGTTGTVAVINARSTAHVTSNVASTEDAKGKTKGVAFDYTYEDAYGVTQTIPAIRLARKSFGVTLLPGTPITGGTTGAYANVVAQVVDVETRPIGDNANVTANATVANNRISSISMIDSGFGYRHGDLLTLTPRTGNVDILSTASATVNSYGVGEGYWGDTKSFIGEQKIHDNDKYQEYSYEVISKLSVDKYERMLKKLVHVGGTKLFAAVEHTGTMNLASSIAGSNIATA